MKNPTTKNTWVKVLDYFYIEIVIFLLQNAIHTFYNLYNVIIGT